MIERESPSFLATRGMVVAIAALLCPAPAAMAGDVEAGRAEARKCRTCHGINGIGRMPNVPHLAGESEQYLTKQLRAFRSGERADPRMSVIARDLSDEDIENLAAWYAAIEISVEVPATGGD